MTQPCILCGADDGVTIQTGIRYAPETLVRRCSGCALISLSPIPTEQALAKYYADTYRAEYEGVVSPEDSYRKGIEPARERVRRMVPWLKPTARVLEVGSSSGAFLEAVRPYAASVSGVEPGVLHAAWAREKFGLTVVNRLADLEYRNFDVIALFHSLEHFRDPVTYIRELKMYLAPGGCFVVEVPSVDDALISLYKVPGFAGFYFQRAHLYYFSPDTLVRTFALAGGKADVIGVQRYDLSNHMCWMLTGKPGGQGSYKSVFPASVNLAYSEALIAAGYADTLWAVVRFDVDNPGC